MSKCGCTCKCHEDETAPWWTGPCAACCEPGMDCACGRALTPPPARVEAIIERAKHTPYPTGDNCARLWPVAQCQWMAGHYGGCATR